MAILTKAVACRNAGTMPGACLGRAVFNFDIAAIARGWWACYLYGDDNPKHVVLGVNSVVRDTDGADWHLFEHESFGALCEPCWTMAVSLKGMIRPHFADCHFDHELCLV